MEKPIKQAYTTFYADHEYQKKIQKKSISGF